MRRLGGGGFLVYTELASTAHSLKDLPVATFLLKKHALHILVSIEFRWGA
jgi:hypothetical protein